MVTLQANKIGLLDGRAAQAIASQANYFGPPPLLFDSVETIGSIYLIS